MGKKSKTILKETKKVDEIERLIPISWKFYIYY
jgi:hypothetical protein